MMMDDRDRLGGSDDQRIFNAPPILIVLIAIHGLFFIALKVLPEATSVWIFWTLAMVPHRLTAMLSEVIFGDSTKSVMLIIMSDQWGIQWARMAAIVSLVGYALIHTSFFHLAVNMAFLLAFGAPPARFFPPLRLILYYGFCAFAGSFMWYLLNPYGQAPLIGASAAISGLAAASARLMFAPGGTLDPYWRRLPMKEVEPLSLHELWHHRQARGFVLFWIGFNGVLGLASFVIPGLGMIAWSAHIGGFVGGLLVFDLFHRSWGRGGSR